MPIERLAERLVYENAFVRVWDDDVRFPNGETGRYFRTRWTAPWGVAVAATDGEAVLLVETHRYGEPRAAWELPKGFGAHGSTPEADARRELLEETGLAAETLEPLGGVGAGYREHLFLARVPDLSRAHAAGAEREEVFTAYKRAPLAALADPDFDALGVADALSMVGLTLAAARLRR